MVLRMYAKGCLDTAMRMERESQLARSDKERRRHDLGGSETSINSPNETGGLVMTTHVLETMFPDNNSHAEGGACGS